MIKKIFSVIIVFVLCFSISTVVSAEEAVINEKENNNKLKKANSLEIGKTMVAKLSKESDVDYFKLTTTVTGDILFHFSHEADGVYSYYWYVQVLNSDNEVLNEGTLSGREATDFSVKAVPSGKYYLKISRISGGNPLVNGFTTAPYMISYKTKCLTHGELNDWEFSKEPSCHNDGERIRTCSVCNDIVVTESIEKLQHSFTDWSVVTKAELFQNGENKRTCMLCGDIETEKTVAQQTTIAIYGAIALVIILIIVAIVNHSKSKKSYSYTGNRNSSSSYGSSYSGSSSYSSDYSSSSYNNSSYSSDSSLDDYYPYTSNTPTGTVQIGGESYDVYTHDAEGYSTGPYIEDAEGYKTSVDPNDVEPPFNWCDL